MYVKYVQHQWLQRKRVKQFLCLFESRISNKLILDILYIKLFFLLNRLIPNNLTIIKIQQPWKFIRTYFQHHLPLLAIFVSYHLLLQVDVVLSIWLLCFSVLYVKAYTGKLVLECANTDVHVLDSLVINVHWSVQ